MKAAVLYMRRAMGPTKFGDCVRDLAVADFMPTKKHPQGPRMIENRWQSLCDMYVNLGRNALVRHFLDSLKADLFFSLDDDSDFLPWQFYETVSHVDPVLRPIVSGLYFAHNGEERARARPLVLRKNEAGKMKTIWNYRPNTLEPVDSVGMGFCAIHRRVLEEWRAKHGDTWFNFTGTGLSDGFRIEDASFAQRMQSIGAKSFVHTGVTVGHLKIKVVGEADYLFRRSLEEAVARKQTDKAKESQAA